MRQTKIVAGVLGIGLSVVLAGGAAAQLVPPAGPIVKTGKTLTEVEPRIAVNAANTPGDADSVFRITQPGSYYLTGNITGVSGKHGIEIVASGVSIDLNGFELLGVPGSLDGVSTTVTSLTNLAVRNGSVRNWGDDGIQLSISSSNSNCLIENVLSESNGEVGIYAGLSSGVSNCVARSNGTIGIFALVGANVSDCIAVLNGGNGILVQSSSTVASCTSTENQLSGINAGAWSTITGCTSNQNAAGGIELGGGGTISNSTAAANDSHGIEVGSGSLVTGCTVRSNMGDGIRCSSTDAVVGNLCTDNGTGSTGAGIHATGPANRIEGNTCINNVRNYDIDSDNNVIIRNTAAGGTTVNWDVATGNVILIVNAATAGAIFGDSGGVSPGSTNPNANYTH